MLGGFLAIRPRPARCLLWALTLGLAMAPAAAFAQDRTEMERADECSPGMQLNEDGLPEMDCATLEVLIRHDHYTIGLLRQVLKQARRPELRTLIEQMIRDHEAEMARLTVLRNTWYGEAPDETQGGASYNRAGPQLPVR